MSRRKDSRRQRPELKLHVEPLEARWLLSADARRPRPDPAAAPLARSLESLLASRSDAGSFAQELAQHPRLADDLGLGGSRRRSAATRAVPAARAGASSWPACWTPTRATPPPTISMP